MQGEVKENIDKKSVNDHRVEVDKIFDQNGVSKWFEPSQANPFVLNAPFLYPLKTSTCFQGVDKGYIRKKWVNKATSRFIAVNLKETHNCSKMLPLDFLIDFLKN